MAACNHDDKEVDQFLVEFYLQSLGDPSVTVSWYDVGEALEMDRTASSNIAEELIGTGLAEIKTLNGGISITADGVDKAEQLGAVIESRNEAIPSISDTPVLDATACQAVTRITTDLKTQMGKKDLDFGSLSEMVAGLNAIDDQLSSPNPETPIILKCLRSIKRILEKIDDTDSLIPVNALLGK
jgi:hypothetical protein